MLHLVQLQDGCYKVVIDISFDSISIHKEYVFTPAESNAEPMVDGDRIDLEFKGE